MLLNSSHIFPPSSFDEPGLQLNSNWDDNVVGSAIGIDYHPVNPGYVLLPSTLDRALY
jgi:hypothetical protein